MKYNYFQEIYSINYIMNTTELINNAKNKYNYELYNIYNIYNKIIYHIFFHFDIIKLINLNLNLYFKFNYYILLKLK